MVIHTFVDIFSSIVKYGIIEHSKSNTIEFIDLKSRNLREFNTVYDSNRIKPKLRLIDITNGYVISKWKIEFIVISFGASIGITTDLNRATGSFIIQTAKHLIHGYLFFSFKQ